MGGRVAAVVRRAVEGGICGHITGVVNAALRNRSLFLQACLHTDGLPLMT
jgi:hypothetical protein